MIPTTIETPWIRHVLTAPVSNEPQHCILCGATVSSHPLGALPDGAVFEHAGRLFLIEPDEAAISCLEYSP